MRAGDLNRTITILRKVQIGAPNDYGEYETIWQIVHRLRANVKWGAVAERLDGTANQRFAAGTVAFKVRWFADLHPTDVIGFDGKFYNIVGSTEIGRRVGLEITATWRQGELQ
ncbi:head-tail adaptor [Rhizobium sp. RU35A]|uniref:head-tail adaptor protein n=1 Tax=Rhizobium sp. RU35A TaxID=1907414 RepID=UPI000956E52E|nr:head-tail adaptor protein [Rhizobium sp. RU35A]SIQ98746.1 head-tail adaptor [Rhizobium sp. RU35A]